MTVTDALGLPLSGATPQALEHYEQARDELRCFVGDPLASVGRAIEAAPGMTMAHALMAWLLLTSTEGPAWPMAREAIAAADALPKNRREALHLQALQQLAAHRWRDAARTLEDLTIEVPLDGLALQAGHLLDFFTGATRMLRDRVARALPAWQPGMPGYHAVLAMHAFGLEENGQYAAAEEAGRRAVELQPRDSWAWHAVAHVMEMNDRRRDGVAWLGGHREQWSEGSFLAVHNWWHLALFHLGLDETDEVLALLDERIIGPGSMVAVDLVDGSALLWRLMLRGVDVGDRWQVLAERWLPQTADSHYAFNDMHAMMALAAAGRDDDADRLVQAQAALLQSAGRGGGAADDVHFLREVGHDATLAMRDFVRGRHGDAVERLRRVRNGAAAFGGSHAQRDLIDLTLIEAAARDGRPALADALRAERVRVQVH